MVPPCPPALGGRGTGVPLSRITEASCVQLVPCEMRHGSPSLEKQFLLSSVDSALELGRSAACSEAPHP